MSSRGPADSCYGNVGSQDAGSGDGHSTQTGAPIL